MVQYPACTFIYSTGSAYLSVETDPSRSLLKVGCLGMGKAWSIPDHTWDYPLTPELDARLQTILQESGYGAWDECYAADEVPDLQWEVIIVGTDGSKKRSFGQGMKSPGLDTMLCGLKSLVSDLSQDIHTDLSSLEAVYFCHVANGVNCTFTLFRDQASKVEKTGSDEKEYTLTSKQWDDVVRVVSESGLPRFGFSLTKGSQFASRALYMGGRMVSCLYGGTLGPEWGDFEEKILSAAGYQ